MPSNTLEDLQHQLQTLQDSALLKEALADSDLPREVQRQLRQQFQGKPYDAAAVETAIRDAQARVDPRPWGDGQVYLPGQERPGFGVQLGESEPDRLVRAFDGYWWGEDQKDASGHVVRRFQSLQEAYEQITRRRWHPITVFDELKSPFPNGRRYDSRYRAPDRLSEALSSSSWAAVFGDSMTRRAIQEYRLPNHQLWRALASEIGQASDPTRAQRRVRTGEYNEIPVVPEGISSTFLATPGEQEITFEISKRGGLESVTLEALASDDQRQIRQIPVKLGRAAARTLQRYFFKQLEDNPNFVDGTALFHANHHNLLAGAPLDVASLDLALQYLAKQPPFNLASGDDALGTLPKYLVHGPTLAFKAAQMVWTQTGAPYTADHSVNFFVRQGLQPLLVPYWTHSKWFVTGDPQDIALFEVTFFGGEDPQLFDASGETTAESMMSADKIVYKVRHFWGLSGALDYRGMVGAL